MYNVETLTVNDIKTAGCANGKKAYSEQITHKSPLRPRYYAPNVHSITWIRKPFEVLHFR